MWTVCKWCSLLGDEGKMILSVDTSNYTTSACLWNREQGIIWQNRILLHPAQQQRGLRQSDAVFLHTKNMETLFDSYPNVRPDAIVASARPRSVEGSYMPCFLVGKNWARAMASVWGCPFTTFSHQENHIMAALYSADCMDLLSDEFVAFHVSGGTSDVLHVVASKSGLSVENIGGSNDLHGGQLIDRIGVMLGFQFPCGKQVEEVASGWSEPIKIKTSVQGTQFHLSGFENQAKELIENGSTAAHVSKFALECILQTLSKVVLNIRSKSPNMPILFVGGVMSNQYIAQQLSAQFDQLYFSDPFYSSDHALGNAVLYDYFKK